MYRVSGADTLLIVRLPALGRKLLALTPVEFGELPGHYIAVFVGVIAAQGLEQAAPDDLKPLLGAGRTPGRFDPANDVFQALQCLYPALSANLGSFIMRGGRVRCGQADDQQAVVGGLGCFRQGLSKTELGIEAAARQVAVLV